MSRAKMCEILSEVGDQGWGEIRGDCFLDFGEPWVGSLPPLGSALGTAWNVLCFLCEAGQRREEGSCAQR